MSEDGELPGESVSAPYELLARVQCDEPAVVGREGSLELEVSYDDQTVVVPSGNAATIDGNLVVVEFAKSAADMPGAFGGWHRLKLLIVNAGPLEE